MGTRYVNLTLYGVTQDELINYLADRGYNSYVSPTENNFTTIYDSSFETSGNINNNANTESMYQAYARMFQLHNMDSDQNLQLLKYAVTQPHNELAKVKSLDNQANKFLRQYSGTKEGILVCWASHLSQKFSCSALAVYVRDDSQFWYHLSRNGKMIDEYTTYAGENWQPGKAIFSELGTKIKGGDAKKFCVAFNQENKIDEVESILRKPQGFGINDEISIESKYGDLLNLNAFPDAVTRHHTLTLALGITPWWVLHMSYIAITQGEAKDYFDDYEKIYGLSSDQAMALLKQAKANILDEQC
ncbi:hypothetical protein [Nostoc sp. FACHB-280]|uniref:hypothetical protein n=1 Tax=Nostoc sp. FACHB-280 TaxID=2692839 RepID=UPI00168B9045|nr:hypothetical protein [Nostoc sp. FACHB-280]MBD2493262.1 hypothetical protein [Nostoc sp. FACHB-280]